MNSRLETSTPYRLPGSEGNFYTPLSHEIGPGMNLRIQQLRKRSVEANHTLSIERALLETACYRENYGKYSTPILRAMVYLDFCRKKTLYMGDNELIVGERGPEPKAVPTFPELTCHTVEDFNILNTRDKQPYEISQSDIDTYAEEVIPYWQGRTQRERIFSNVPEPWRVAYEAGVFTEFMEQRAPGHTVLDGKIYRKGLLDFKRDIADQLSSLDYLHDADATDKAEQLKAMDIACDACIVFAQRHADLAEEKARTEKDLVRKAELEKIAAVCRWVPANAPRTFWEAIQMYWFIHLGTITELNGWDAMNPGHFDQHLTPFFEKEVNAGTLTRDEAKELLCCFWIKVNNHPAPPKVGVTARESGTYNDFTNINIGGVKTDGSDGVSEVSYIMLEVIEELHILQPGSSVHLSSKTPNRFLNAACRVIRQGHGYPAIFNADEYIMEMLRTGKRIEDAREGGVSGCIETGAFGKEAFLLTGYLNLPKILEITLNDGCDPRTGNLVGLKTGNPLEFKTYKELYAAFIKQTEFFVDIKARVSNYIDRMVAKYTPAPFLSVFIDDCISKGRDYYDGGPRYNTNYIQCCGLGTICDSLAVIKKHVFEDGKIDMKRLLSATAKNFEQEEWLRQFILHKTPFFGNNDSFADDIAVTVYEDLIAAIEKKPNIKGESYHLNLLSTTCHLYFGKVTGATPNARLAGKPISDGTSPSHGADKKGPSMVVKSLSKLDHTKSGGTLLNQRFMPSLLKRDEDISKLGSLVRTYFALGGHHIQFNIVDTATLKAAQESPDDYNDLLVRVAGYSDYFNDLSSDVQQEIIDRTENNDF